MDICACFAWKCVNGMLLQTNVIFKYFLYEVKIKKIRFFKTKKITWTCSKIECGTLLLVFSITSKLWVNHLYEREKGSKIYVSVYAICKGKTQNKDIPSACLLEIRSNTRTYRVAPSGLTESNWLLCEFYSPIWRNKI